MSCLLSNPTVFFGESLPDRFHHLLQKDLPKADLLLVMGTSLQVAPVSHIPDMVSCNRVLFNRDMVMRIRKGSDMFVSGDCDETVQSLCDLLGWGEALLEANSNTTVRKKEGSENGTEEPLDAEKKVEGNEADKDEANPKEEEKDDKKDDSEEDDQGYVKPPAEEDKASS